jgi:hypothetical protein
VWVGGWVGACVSLRAIPQVSADETEFRKHEEEEEESSAEEDEGGCAASRTCWSNFIACISS